MKKQSKVVDNVINFEKSLEKIIIKKIAAKHHVGQSVISPLIKQLKEHNYRSGNDMIAELDFYFQMQSNGVK